MTDPHLGLNLTQDSVFHPKRAQRQSCSLSPASSFSPCPACLLRFLASLLSSASRTHSRRILPALRLQKTRPLRPSPIFRTVLKPRVKKNSSAHFARIPHENQKRDFKSRPADSLLLTSRPFAPDLARRLRLASTFPLTESTNYTLRSPRECFRNSEPASLSKRRRLSNSHAAWPGTRRVKKVSKIASDQPRPLPRNARKLSGRE